MLLECGFEHVSLEKLESDSGGCVDTWEGLLVAIEDFMDL